jgi:hypothetical protein
MSERQILKGEVLACAEADRSVTTNVRPSRHMRGSVSDTPRGGQRLWAGRSIGEGQPDLRAQSSSGHTVGRAPMTTMKTTRRSLPIR